MRFGWRKGGDFPDGGVASNVGLFGLGHGSEEAGVREGRADE